MINTNENNRADIPVSKFNLILEDGGFLSNCTLRCKKGIVRDRRDLNNALKWEREVKLCNSDFKDLVITNNELYNFEIAE